MRDIAKEMREKVGMQVGDWPALIHEAADEIDRLRTLCRSAGLSVDPPRTWNEVHGWDERG